MNSYLRNKKGFASLIGLVLAVAIVCFLAYIALNTYFKRPIADKSLNQTLSEQKIDTTSYQSLIKSTKSKIEDITQQRSQELENLTPQSY